MPPLKDSGKRRIFKSGAQRDRQKGKGRFDLLPMHAMFRDALTMEKGAIKYNDRNWEKGMPLSQFLDSALRHFMKAMLGLTDEDHWSQAHWNIGCLMETKFRIDMGMLPKELDDLPPELPKKVQKRMLTYFDSILKEMKDVK